MVEGDEAPGMRLASQAARLAGGEMVLVRRQRCIVLKKGGLDEQKVGFMIFVRPGPCLRVCRIVPRFCLRVISVKLFMPYGRACRKETGRR